MDVKIPPEVHKEGAGTEDHYRRLYEDAPIGIYRTTPKGQIIDGNPTLVRMLGYPDLETLKSANVYDLYVEPAERAREQAQLAHSGKVYSIEFQLRRGDNQVIWVRDTAQAFRDEEGNILYYEGSLEDITERVKAEEALLASEVRIGSERAQRQLAETLSEVANIINSTLELDEVFERVLSSLSYVVPYDSSMLLSIQDDQLKVLAHRGFNNIEFINQLNIPIMDDQLSQHILETKRPLVLEDAQSDPRFHGYVGTKHTKSWMGVPLFSQEGVIGILTLDSTQPNAYGERAAQVAFAFASQVVTAIENARLFEAERQRANELAALSETIADLAAELELSRLLRAILNRAIALLGVTGGELGLLDENSGEIVISNCINMVRDYTGVRMKPGQGAIGWVMETQKPLLIPDYRTWDGHLPKYVDWPWRGVLAVPMTVRDQLVGVIALADTNPERIFDDSDLQLLNLFAQQAAIAIYNAQLFEETETALTNAQALYRTAGSLINTEHAEDMLTDLVNIVSDTLPADRVVLITVDLDQQEVIDFVVGGQGSEHVQTNTFQQVWDGLSGWAIRERQPVLSPKGVPDPRESLALQQIRVNNNGGDIIVVPLIYRDQVLGTLTAINRFDQRDFTQGDVDLMTTIANHASLAIKNAQLFEEIQRLAEIDDLTGLYNRRHLFKLGNLEFSRARRYSTPLSAIMLDIDHFKKVNDTYGHATGDQVLKFLAQLCLGNLREIDILGRYGGEEFVILLPQTSIEAAKETAERLRECVAQAVFPGAAEGLNIKISLGVAELSEAIPDLASLIDRADTAMYAAKEGGRNRTEILVE
jgi:diguanylate cyclase (GGDEF)-like protein/PAS domain S-box-containing protein